MALKIRMSRWGAKKRPFYRIVVADSRKPRDGRYLEKVGTFDPMLRDVTQRLKYDAERVKFWLARGAKPSDRCARFFSLAGLVTWKHGNNPEKAIPKAKAQERLKAAAGGAAAAAAPAPAAPAAPAPAGGAE
jgi:small subunit ribosomal protein S16